MEEQWKDVAGYEGLYQVSNQGRVKSLERTVVAGNGATMPIPERILKAKPNNRGYQFVSLWKEGKQKHMLIHRLVAQAFLPNQENYNEVNHKDENKENNHVDNLEWCTSKYNANYGTRNERRVEKRSKPVQQFTIEGSFVREWPSTKEAGRNGFDQSAVSACCNGKYGYKSHKGFIWQYA